MPADDERQELEALIAGFHAHLTARGRAGLLGVPTAASPRSAVATTSAGSASADASADASAVVPVVAAVPGEGVSHLARAREELGDCQRCGLCVSRTNIVFGSGNPDADLVFVGEAPGADEDQQGQPFVGNAGQLLTKMIEAMGFGRDDVYICNVLKCRPPGNRNPAPAEVAACEPFLRKQLTALRPKMIVTLGKFAAHTLLQVDTPITRLRGTFSSYEGIAVMPTYHPAYLLREPARKRDAWQDLQTVLGALQKLGIDPPRQKG